MVVEQDWRPKDLPLLEEAFNGDEHITLFLPGMNALDAWEFIPGDLNAPLTIEFSEEDRLFIPGRN